MEFHGCIKTNWSRPVDEDMVTVHLCTEDDEEPLCGIDKVHPDIYNISPDPIELTEGNLFAACKRCEKSVRKIMRNEGMKIYSHLNEEYVTP